MKYINLEHPASICSIVLFVYKPPWGEEHDGRRGTWQAYWVKESADTWLVGLHRNRSVFSLKDRGVEVLCATSLVSRQKEEMENTSLHGPHLSGWHRRLRRQNELWSSWLFGKGFENAFIRSYISDDSVSLTFCAAQALQFGDLSSVAGENPLHNW